MVIFDFCLIRRFEFTFSFRAGVYDISHISYEVNT